MTAEVVLSDVLSEGMLIVFCGTAAGKLSAELRQPYSHPGNRFWTVLHETGLTPEKLGSAFYRDLPEFGIGLTDLAKFAS